MQDLEEQTTATQIAGLQKEFVKAYRDKKKLERLLAICKTTIDDMRTPLLAWFEEAEIQSVNVDGYSIYKSEKLTAKATDIAAIAACPETADLVKQTCHYQTLAAFVRECAENPALGYDAAHKVILPDGVKDAIEVSSFTQLAARQS